MASSESDMNTFSFLRRRREPSEDFGRTSSELERVVIFFGIITAGSGIWECLQCVDPFNLEGNISQYKFPGKMLLFSGAVLVSTSIVTISEAVNLTRLAAICLSRSLSVAMFLETIGGAAALALAISVSEGFFSEDLREELKNEYAKNQHLTFTLDSIQKEYNCCGINGPEDYMESYWTEEKVEGVKMKYPDSCCGGKHDCKDDEVRKTGCASHASEALYYRLKWNYLCSFSCILVHLSSYMLLSFLEQKL